MHKTKSVRLTHVRNSVEVAQNLWTCLGSHPPDSVSYLLGDLLQIA